MANANMTIRLDENLKQQADALFSDLGISTNAAITMFIKQAVREQKIPFEVKRIQPNITFSANETLADVSRQIIEKNLPAYKELAK